MKILKLIGLMLLGANFLMAQTDTYSAPHTNVLGTGNAAIGVDAGISPLIGNYNTNIGYQAGQDVEGDENVFIGKRAGWKTKAASSNVGIGSESLKVNAGGSNLAIGYRSGQNNTTGSSNIFMGSYAGNGNTTGAGNTYIGNSAGTRNNGNSNIAIGYKAGLIPSGTTSSGSYNVFIGANAGNGIEGANKLHIQSSNNPDITTPLIYGDFLSGKVGIDTSYVPSDYTLAVNGKTMTEEVQVMLSEQWPDYVFAEDYNLMSLTDLEAEIETLGHLPGVPSATEVEENGHALGQMDAILLEKVEELTLHLIDMNKEMEKLRKRNQALETRLSEVEDK